MSSESKPTSLSRREVVSQGVALATGCVVAAHCDSLFGKDELGRATKETSHSFSEEMWANMVGQSFKVLGYSYQEGEANLRKAGFTLVETEEISFGRKDKARPKEIRPNAVSLLFRAASSDLESVSVRVFHPWVGELDLLVTRMQLEKYPRQHIYEAVLN